KDIINRKKTYLWILANQRAGKKEKAELNALMGNDEISKNEKIKSVRHIYDKLNISMLASEKINMFFDEASKLISRVDVDPGKKSDLKRFLSQLNKRDF
ncbi:MAG: hypothetical protein PF590_09685, partial [Candidatus Delongbacteria bacterium]|nr:hypothetical protein [Candidatus Delongbacteria bacterium]